MDGQQRILHDIVDMVGGYAPPPGDDSDQGHALPQQRLIGETIAGLRTPPLAERRRSSSAAELRLGSLIKRVRTRE